MDVIVKDEQVNIFHMFYFLNGMHLGDKFLHGLSALLQIYQEFSSNRWEGCGQWMKFNEKHQLLGCVVQANSLSENINIVEKISSIICCRKFAQKYGRSKTYLSISLPYVGLISLLKWWRIQICEKETDNLKLHAGEY